MNIISLFSLRKEYHTPLTFVTQIPPYSDHLHHIHDTEEIEIHGEQYYRVTSFNSCGQNTGDFDYVLCDEYDFEHARYLAKQEQLQKEKELWKITTTLETTDRGTQYITILDSENIPYEEVAPFAYIKSSGAIFIRFSHGKRVLCIRKGTELEMFPFNEKISYSRYFHFMTRKSIESAKTMYKRIIQRIQYQQKENGVKVFSY